MEDGLSDDQRQQMLQILTTEYSALQAGHTSTIMETNARTTVFLGVVSSTLVALVFVGQLSKLGTAFFAFAMVLLPTIFFLGLVTYQRSLQLIVEEYIYAEGMSRIRHFYCEMFPQTERYFVGPTHDEFSATLTPTAFGGPVRLGVQSLLTVPSAIALVNSVIVGSFAGLLVRAVGVEVFAFSMGVGIAVFFVSVMMHRRDQLARLNQIDQRLPTLFPKENSSS